MKAKTYSFIDSNVLKIFGDLFKANLIESLKMKWVAEAGKVNDPKYYKYHYFVGHPIHDCFIFKNKVIELAQQEKIMLKEKSTNTNPIALNNQTKGTNEVDDSFH